MSAPLTNDDLLHRLRKRIKVARVAGSNVSLHPDLALALVECSEALQYAIAYESGDVGCIQHWKFVARAVLDKLEAVCKSK